MRTSLFPYCVHCSRDVTSAHTCVDLECIIVNSCMHIRETMAATATLKAIIDLEVEGCN